VVDCEATPDLCRHFHTEDVAQRLSSMDVQIVHEEVDGLGRGVFQRQTDGNLGKLKTRSIRRGEGEMMSGFGLYRTENISRSTALVFVVLSCFSPRYRRRRGTYIR